MSPRAACRLEGLGFTDVYDYVEGIADWKAAGLPVEGEADHVQRVADATRPDVPTCRPEETIDDVRFRVVEAGWDICVVVDCDGVVIGRLHPATHQDHDRATVGEVMSSGPGTVRADGLLDPLVERLNHRDIPHVLVTTPQGTLIGVLVREEANRLVSGETPQRIWQDCECCPGRWTTVR